MEDSGGCEEDPYSSPYNLHGLCSELNRQFKIALKEELEKYEHESKSLQDFLECLELEWTLDIFRGRKANNFLITSGFKQYVKPEAVIIVLKLPDIVMDNHRQTPRQPRKNGSKLEPTEKIDWKAIYDRFRHIWWKNVTACCTHHTLCLRRINRIGQHTRQFYYIFMMEKLKCANCPRSKKSR